MSTRTIMSRPIVSEDMLWLNNVLNECGLFDALRRSSGGRDVKLHTVALVLGDDDMPELNLFGDIGVGKPGNFVVGKCVQTDVTIIARQPAENAILTD